MKHWLFAIGVLGALAAFGCSSASSSPSASPSTSGLPSTSAQADCERTGGVWRAGLTSCKYPAPERPQLGP
jgi:hypothetical protein